MVVLFLAQDHRVFSSMKVCSSLIEDVEDLLFPSQTAIGDLQLGLVERFGLVEVVAVGSPDLVRPLVLLCSPGGAVPGLTIALITTMKVVRLVLHLQLGRSLEDDTRVTAPPVRLIVLLGWVEAGTHGGRAVVLRLMVLSRVEHGAGAVAATPDLHA